MKPLASSSSMYAFIASDSGCDRGNTLPLVGIAPGSRSMAQSLDRCGGSWEALDLLNASERSWYSAGRSDTTGVSVDKEDLGFVAWNWNCRHFLWQGSDHCWICLVVQEIRGLCSHGRRGSLWELAKLISMKFPAAPESIKAIVSTITLVLARVMGTSKILGEALTAVVSLVDGRVGQLTRRWPDSHSTGRGGFAFCVPFPPMTNEWLLLAWAQVLG